VPSESGLDPDGNLKAAFSQAYLLELNGAVSTRREEKNINF
jgi:hypothetical protein